MFPASVCQVSIASGGSRTGSRHIIDNFVVYNAPVNITENCLWISLLEIQAVGERLRGLCNGIYISLHSFYDNYELFFLFLKQLLKWM